MVDKGVLDQCMEDISLPAVADEVIACVAGNGSSPEAIRDLRSLRAGTFSSEEALLCDLGDPRYCS
jgi:hypothetical protein